MRKLNLAIALMLGLALTLAACSVGLETPTTMLSVPPQATPIPVAPAEPMQVTIDGCPSKVTTTAESPLKYVQVKSNGYEVFHNASLGVYTIDLASPYEEEASDFGLLNVGDYVEVFCSLDVFSYAAQIKAADPDAVIFVGGREVTPVQNEQVKEFVTSWTGADNGVGIGLGVSGELLFWSVTEQRTYVLIVLNGEISFLDSMEVVQNPFYNDSSHKMVKMKGVDWTYFFVEENPDGSVNVSHPSGVFLFLYR